ncbi:hypothetical protein WA026_001276 [Henosepilachna vigintioctopunctata]|uniref:Exonuclease 1 n=1 Tax=Henosepilachna vigintioctopunctata TaxID=420089 RepID=A0AAW1UQH2_9CUCU
MGITGLLPFLEQATRNCNISEFRGATVAVDSYCWLHKGATACADILARGEDTDVYVNFCMKYVKMLQKFDIKVILVFDGNHLPAKALTEKRRRETRKNAKVRAAELLRLGKKDEAWNFLRQSVDITPLMAFNLIKECRRNNIDCIVAPYESDSQLAYLNLKGIADVIITEDSDLLVFGCSKVFFKMDINGNGRLVDKEKIAVCMKMKPDNYSFDKFRYMCILSGCDYLDSIHGVGLKKALKFFSMTAETDPLKFLDKVPRYLNLKNQVVNEEYKENFMVADATFRHQIVYDPLARKLTYLTDPAVSGTRPEYCRNAGKFLDENIAFQVAVGNLNPYSYEKYDDWSPSGNWSSSLHSIWSSNYVKKISRRAQKEIDKMENLKLESIQAIKQNKLETEKKIVDEVQAFKFESQLDIYYSKSKCNQLVYSKKEERSEEENMNLEVIKDEPHNIEKQESTLYKENSCEEEFVKDKSPILNKKFINPFLKKKLSKFNSVEIDEKVIVRSKYFHSKSEEICYEQEKIKEDVKILYEKNNDTVSLPTKRKYSFEEKEYKVDENTAGSDLLIDSSCNAIDSKSFATLSQVKTTNFVSI